MSKRVRTMARIGVIALALLLPIAAGADSEPDHESTGSVVSIDGQNLVLDRRGDKVSFQRAGGTSVRGAKSSWGDLSQGDRITVHWNLSDKPKKAYRIDVMPPRK